MKTIRHAVAVVVPAVLALLAGFAVMVFALARKVVTPVPRGKDTEILAVDTSAQTIELSRTPDTELPGRYGLFTDGSVGYVKLGAVLGIDAAKVRRKLLTKIDAGAKIDRMASFSGWYYQSPAELHLNWESAMIETPVGENPAWYFSASSSTWVIQVHGRGAMRAECLRAVPVFHALGMPNLVVSYRNDGEAVQTPRGTYALGVAEWADIDAALRYARERGAEKFIIMGWSMGGAVTLQTLLSSSERDSIIGVVLDSPVVDWRTVLRFQAGASGVKEPLPSLAMSALASPLTAAITGAEQAISFDDLDIVARADELTVPVLILHSDDDGYVPSDASHALAKARPDLVTMHAFSVARHTKLWNYDQTGWTAAIVEWMSAQGFTAEESVPAEG